MDSKPSTRSEILTRLRRGPQRVAELVAALGVTRNAILVPLLDLEAKGLVKRVDTQRTGRAGKPAQLYALVAEEMEKASPAYQALAPHLFQALMDGGEAEGKKTMISIGSSIGADLSRMADAKRESALVVALDFLRSQGAEIETRVDGEDLLVLSHSCPIGVLVRVDRCICTLIASVLGKASGAPATAECVYAAQLTCQFRLQGQAGHAASRPS